MLAFFPILTVFKPECLSRFTGTSPIGPIGNLAVCYFFGIAAFYPPIDGFSSRIDFVDYFGQGVIGTGALVKINSFIA